jgi:PAS domain-containing protein
MKGLERRGDDLRTRLPRHIPRPARMPKRPFPHRIVVEKLFTDACEHSEGSDTVSPLCWLRINRTAIVTGGLMFPIIALADEILQTAVNVIRVGDRTRLRALDVFPAAIYATDIDGFISYFNPACVDFAGRNPVMGQDRWCITWKLYTDDGEYLPHEQCPMAIAIQTRHAVRGVTAIAERPNGVRINFLPFPTPVVSDHGEILGAVNMLIDIAGFDRSMSRRLHEHLRSWQLMLVEQALAAFTIDDVRELVREIELKLERQTPPVFN